MKYSILFVLAVFALAVCFFAAWVLNLPLWVVWISIGISPWMVTAITTLVLFATAVYVVFFRHSRRQSAS